MSGLLLMNLFGRVITLSGILLLLPLPISFFCGSPSAFLMPAIFSLALGLTLTRAGRAHRERILVREGACFLVGVWVYLPLISMMPYVLADAMPPLSALSESVSSLTTTGLTLLPDGAAPDLVFWRSLTQWMGGLNIILLLVTVVPQVSGWFGTSLAMPVNMSPGQLISSMRRISFGVFRVYAAATAVFTLIFFACGLTFFDALNLSLTSIATGGCYDAPALSGSRGVLVGLFKIFSMLFASGNFFIYWAASRRRRMSEIFSDTEMRSLLGMTAFFTLIVSVHLWQTGTYGFAESLGRGFFGVASFISTTGAEPALFAGWPDFDRFLLFLMVFSGGCIASSTGGFKVMRFLVLMRSTASELTRTLHPRLVARVAVGRRVVPIRMVWHLLCFFFIFMGIFFMAVLLLSLTGLTPLAAIGLAAASLTSAGPAALLAGDVGEYASLTDGVRMICCALMILGRLEIFSFLLVIQTAAHQWSNRW